MISVRLASLAALLACPLALFASAPAQEDAALVDRDIRFVGVPRIVHTPLMDGDLADYCWSKAKKIDGFRLTAGKPGAVPKRATTAWLAYDATHLYIAVECIEPDPSCLRAPSRARDDSDIEFDDRVEVFIDVAHDHRHYWHLAINAAGSVFDQSVFYRLHGARTNEAQPEHDLRVRSKTKVGADRWCLELEIDLAAMGIDPLEEGVTCGFNLGRVSRPDVSKGDEISRRKPGPDAEYSAWAPTRDHLWETPSNFHAPLEFGDLVFGDPGFSVERISLPAAQFTMGGVGHPSRFGDNPAQITLTTADGKSRELIATLAVEAEGAAPTARIERATFPSGRPAAFRYGVARHGENRLTLTLSDALFGRVYYKTHYTDVAPPFADFDLAELYAPALSGKGASLRLRLVASDEIARSAEMKLSFLDANGKALQNARLDKLPKPGEAVPVFDLDALRALPGGDYSIACTLVDLETGRTLGEFVQPLTKPSARSSASTASFGIEQGPRSFAGIASQALAIRFPDAPPFVFWKAACNVPWWESDQFAVSNEFVEAWGAGTQGCAEPMQDRECRYSAVQVLENNPARIVVHWRYALADARYKIHAGEWVDEYYTFYPDGVGVREVRLWGTTATEHEVMEIIPVKPPGVSAADMFAGPAVSLTRLDGARWTAAGDAKNASRYREFLSGGIGFVARVHLRDRPQPFTVFALREDVLPGVKPSHVSLGRDPLGPAEQRGHWPASEWALDGYNAIGRHVPTHFSLGNIHVPVDPAKSPNTWRFLLGTAPADDALPERHARAWLSPASLEILGGTEAAAAYDSAQRAYRLSLQDGASRTRLLFRSPAQAGKASGQPDAGVVHPVLLIAAPPSRALASVTIAGKALESSAFATGRAATGEIILYLSAEVPYGAALELAWK